MGLLANIRRDLKFAAGLRRLLERIKPITLDSPTLVCDDLEEAVDRFPDRIAIEDEHRSLTYREFDSMANRFAHWARGRNLKRSDTVALVMLNRAEYLAAWFGLSKVGVATALTLQVDAHRVTLVDAREPGSVTTRPSWTRSRPEATPVFTSGT